MPQPLQVLQSELRTELDRILNYWSQNTLDFDHGGFWGRIDHRNKIVSNAPKGIILNTRILWSFSAASNHLKTNEYQFICDRAHEYLKDHFKDSIHSGVFWELDYTGNPINTRKQIYAQAFAIYALSEYYILSKNEEAKQWAIQLFEIIEKVAKDPLNGGYLEAFREDWSPIEDMRLSTKDMNASKTMNTHLHILEAYTRLSDIYENDQLKSSLKELVFLFQERFLTVENHYDLFFDTNWNLLSSVVSYGHDIETAWLVIEAVKRLKNNALLKEVQDTAIRVANTFLQEAIDDDMGVINEKNTKTGHVDQDRHWWPQMEAIVGLGYVYDVTNNAKYIETALSIWKFAKKHLIDHENGEWHFRVDKNGAPYTQEDKVSMWKAPYHTTRACISLSAENPFG
ncbi:AGE family epimerase/isomerase [Muricauda sp. CAU 1633]|uniref:AGE family epimerase/isomerase n=1 Tax=Allomuricauda sp. CAU 1633 TaxID=2816036 RepID=UPI001A8F0E4E|nr:AGE family epimerase/isomerase [Muricauda sp. CAU 1633]MBO0321047.1 AGE family epimerase/isomerase [Muricauda sp. CAU 1633]